MSMNMLKKFPYDSICICLDNHFSNSKAPGFAMSDVILTMLTMLACGTAQVATLRSFTFHQLEASTDSSEILLETGLKKGAVLNENGGKHIGMYN